MRASTRAGPLGIRGAGFGYRSLLKLRSVVGHCFFVNGELDARAAPLTFAASICVPPDGALRVIWGNSVNMQELLCLLQFLNRLRIWQQIAVRVAAECEYLGRDALRSSHTVTTCEGGLIARETVLDAWAGQSGLSCPGFAGCRALLRCRDCS